MAEPHQRRTWTATEVMKLVDLGVLGEDEHVELIEGELITMAPQGPMHAGWKSILHRRLQQAFGESALVVDQIPLDCGEASLPEPDLAVVKGDPHAFVKRHPRADETVVVLELTWTSHSIDHQKAPVYAAGGAPEYWIIDLKNRRLEVHREAGGAGYNVVTILAENQRVCLPGTDEEWTVESLLP